MEDAMTPRPILVAIGESGGVSALRMGRAHLTRRLGDVRSVAVASGSRDEDRALCIECDDGRALLTFLDQTPGVP